MRSAVCSVAAVALLFGCASKEPSAQTGQIEASRVLRKAKQGRLPAAVRAGYLLAAAQSALGGSEAPGKAGARARQIYNAAAADLVLLLRESPGLWNAQNSFRAPQGNYRLRFARGSARQGIWDPGFFDAFLDPGRPKRGAPATVVNPGGFGGILVGRHTPSNSRKWLLPPRGVLAPVTAVVDFPATGEATITLYDPTQETSARIGGRKRLLTADLGAPTAFYPDPWWIDYLALFNAAGYEDREGMYFFQPYDPDRIPVVLVHGLMSIPQMWLPIVSQIEMDPELRGRFQFWTFAYPTGDPVVKSALGLRESLAAAYKVYPKTKDMVMVSYSLGGLLGKMQVQTSGETVWKGVFGKEAAEVKNDTPPDSLLRRALVFEANPRIKRMVFICTPHRGSPLASGFLGKLGRSLIMLPASVVGGVNDSATRAIAVATGQRGTFLPNSIWGLSPKSPLLVSLNRLPISSPFHSIIGNQGRDNIPLEKSSDGVVPYPSAHLDGAVSERIVPAQHVTACQNPESIEELKRILRLHLKKAGEP